MKPGCVSLVIPIFNEEANLPELVRRCLEVGRALDRPFELVLVDDGSKDGSRQMLAAAAERDPAHVVAVLLNRNYGQHAAVMAGLAQARGDVVGGVRRRRMDTWFRRTASRTMNRIIAKITGVFITDYGCMLRAYRRDIVDAMLASNERSVYVPALGNSFAGNLAEVIVEHAERRAGESKYRLRTLLNLYFDLLVGTTTAPLRLLSFVGTASAIAGLAFGVLLFVLRFVYGPGWAAEGVFTIFAVLFIFLGVQLLGMGLLGEYIGRISRDVQRRPRYLVHEVVGSGYSAGPSTLVGRAASREIGV